MKSYSTKTSSWTIFLRIFFSPFTLLPNIIKAAAHYLNHNRDLELLEIMMRLTRRLNLGFLLSENTIRTFSYTIQYVFNGRDFYRMHFYIPDRIFLFQHMSLAQKYTTLI